MSSSPPEWSADGNWFWDGSKWNDAVSADGKWRFDGREWKPFQGLRSPMPPPPPPPPSGPAAPAPSMPDWVAQSEIDRLAQEAREREQLAAQAALPQPPLPPELDWRRVGEHMEFHHQQKEYASWQVGPTSVIIYLLLYWLCVPASLYFITRTGWRFTTKVIVAVLTSGVWILIVFAVVALRAQTAQP
jgi:hypothetical protein